MLKKEKKYVKMLRDMVPQDGASLQKLVKHLSGKQLGMLTEFFSTEERKSKKRLGASRLCGE